MTYDAWSEADPAADPAVAAPPPQPPAAPAPAPGGPVFPAAPAAAGAAAPSLADFPFDPADDGPALVARALDPDDPGVALVAAPGKRPASPPSRGDVIVQQGVGAPPQMMVMGADPLLGVAQVAAASALLSPRRRFVRRQVRVVGRDGLTPRGTTILRRNPAGRRGAREAFEGIDGETIPALDPARWAAILSPHATGRVAMRTGNAVRPIIDGPDTFTAMAADMGAASGPGDFIYLLGWDNFDDFPLVTTSAGAQTFRQIYTDAARRGVEVAAMLWDQPFLSPAAHRNASEITRRISLLPNGKGIEDDLTANNTLASRARLIAAVRLAVSNPILIPLIVALIEPDLARLGGSHHQKLLVVKRGETLVGYVGGNDMNPNRVRVVDAGTGQPHHDTHCRIVGPGAFDVLQTFLSRWKHHPQSARFAPLRGLTHPVPRPISAPLPTDAPFGGPVTTLIARTFNPTRRLPPDVVPERSIKPMLLAAIRGARRFIYCEDQYLIDLDTADAIAAALPNLRHVTILIPGNPITDLPLGAEYRHEFVERVLSRTASATDRAKFGVFVKSTVHVMPVFGDHTYVHSKSWVFDDELAVIGTANCNRRSYTFDSEVDAFLFDDANPAPGRPSFAHSYRSALWQHHLGVTGAQVEDGAASGDLWRLPRRPSTAKVSDFIHVLPSSSGWSRGAMEQTVRNFAAPILRDLIDPVP